MHAMYDVFVLILSYICKLVEIGGLYRFKVASVIFFCATKINGLVHFEYLTNFPLVCGVWPHLDYKY